MLPVLVIFDCDGVLVDSERLSVELEARLLSELGWPMTAEELVLRWMGRTAAFQREEIADRLGASAAALFEERSSNEVRAAFETSLQAVPGVIAVLDYLESRGVKTCVASSGTHQRIRLTLGLTNLAHRFEGRIFSAADVAVGKPAPDLFLHAAESLGVAPSQCAVVEDSVFGVQAGVAAGMTVYGFGGGLIDRTLLEQAGAIGFDQITDLVPWPTGSDS
ncbi:MAG: HAD-IA family hydrolase [Acidimicrobiia bacterium]|nr:HAD-IA family hydrolase [Acidimicrobiia bacterium]